MGSSLGTSFLDHLAALRDPRQSWKVVYPLPEVLLTVLSGTLAGAEDFVEIRRWALLHLDFLRRFLPFASGIPSHDTLNDIMNAIDAELFGLCFTQWVSSLGESVAPPETGPEVVAIDGKTSRRTHGRAQDSSPLRLGVAPASRAGPSGLRGQAQRDHRHPRFCSTDWRSVVPWSPSTPWVARPGSRRRSSTRRLMTFSP